MRFANLNFNLIRVSEESTNDLPNYLKVWFLSLHKSNLSYGCFVFKAPLSRQHS